MRYWAEPRALRVSARTLRCDTPDHAAPHVDPPHLPFRASKKIKSPFPAIASP
jgi:hypothetical protein